MESPLFIRRGDKVYKLKNVPDLESLFKKAKFGPNDHVSRSKEGPWLAVEAFLRAQPANTPVSLVTPSQLPPRIALDKNNDTPVVATQFKTVSHKPWLLLAGIAGVMGMCMLGGLALVLVAAAWIFSSDDAQRNWEPVAYSESLSNSTFSDEAALDTASDYEVHPSPATSTTPVVETQSGQSNSIAIQSQYATTISQQPVEPQYTPKQMYEWSLQKGAEGPDYNASDSAYWARCAAEAGHAEGMFEYAVKLLHGTGTEKNVDMYHAWLKRSAESGSPQAMYWLALGIQSGDISPDRSNAYEYYISKSAAAGYQPAAEKLDGEAQAQVVGALLNMFMDSDETSEERWKRESDEALKMEIERSRRDRGEIPN